MNLPKQPKFKTIHLVEKKSSRPPYVINSLDKVRSLDQHQYIHDLGIPTDSERGGARHRWKMAPILGLFCFSSRETSIFETRV